MHWWPNFWWYRVVSQLHSWEVWVLTSSCWPLGMRQYYNHGVWIEAEFFLQREVQVDGRQLGLMVFIVKKMLCIISILYTIMIWVLPSLSFFFYIWHLVTFTRIIKRILKVILYILFSQNIIRCLLSIISTHKFLQLSLA